MRRTKKDIESLGDCYQVPEDANHAETTELICDDESKIDRVKRGVEHGWVDDYHMYDENVSEKKIRVTLSETGEDVHQEYWERGSIVYESVPDFAEEALE